VDAEYGAPSAEGITREQVVVGAIAVAMTCLYFFTRRFM